MSDSTPRVHVTHTEFIGENENEASRVIVIAFLLSVLFADGFLYNIPCDSHHLIAHTAHTTGNLDY